MSLYLDGPVPWLLDPASPDLPALARDAESRRADQPCGDVRADQELLEQVMRERHFGIATGVVDLPELRLPDARVWGDLAELQAELRERLKDNHFRFYGTRSDPPVSEGPAVERSVIDGVRVVRIRRLFGAPEHLRVLADWAADADRDFAHDRIVVDLRGNIGGNDGYTHAWAERRFRGVEGFAKDAGWHVDGAPLGLWNRDVWQHALHGVDVGAPPAGELEVVSETWDIPAGDLRWEGRMVVLVDRASRSSGESSAWLLRETLGARIVGEPTFGMIEYGNIVPYVLPSGLAVALPTKRNDFGFPVERVGFPVDVELDPSTPVEDVVRDFERFI